MHRLRTIARSSQNAKSLLIRGVHARSRPPANPFSVLSQRQGGDGSSNYEESGSSPGSFIPTPYVTETIGGGWHTYDIFSRLLKERIILLAGPINDPLSTSIVSQLLLLESQNPTAPIHLYINSPGGSVTSGLAIYDTMMYISPLVSTICLGQAASMGSLLLAGGAKGSRYCLPHSSVMVHQPSGGYSGQASDIAIHAKEILRVREQLNEIYRKCLRDGISVNEVERMMERDYFMSAKEALDLGIVDEILERRPQEEKSEDED